MVEKIVLSDEKYFQLDGIYNRQIYAATREEAKRKGDIHCKA